MSGSWVGVQGLELVVWGSSLRVKGEVLKVQGLGSRD